MTSPAVASEARFVEITMAVGTVPESQTFPFLVRVTLPALHSLVRTVQRECRPAMVESNLSELDFWRVTPLAVFSQPSLVNVGVASDAARIIDEIGGGLFSQR